MNRVIHMWTRELMHSCDNKAEALQVAYWLNRYAGGPIYTLLYFN